jgi:ribonucleoside-diphosphate reductase alpha chain
MLLRCLLAEKPSIGTFLSEWKSLYDSGSGERGLFSRAAAQRQAARSDRRDATQDFGTNPCW